ncbi:hypothetical protein HPB51_016035 [Rhipicephalus microplus]|uniref:Uncharacterized protein n=1 Tax=Rhipicephalus microplus TaxID=6941 RepID=A0A9J6DHP5_RHIMP|nr:hypothetical protein HPB51_016035 [Rhipicephalus microplus]
MNAHPQNGPLWRPVKSGLCVAVHAGGSAAARRRFVVRGHLAPATDVARAARASEQAPFAAVHHRAQRVPPRIVRVQAPTFGTVPGLSAARPEAATPSSTKLTTAQLAYVLIGSCTALSVLCLAAVAGCSFHRCRRRRHTAAAAARAATHLLDPSWSLGPRNVGGTFGRCRLPFGAASSLRGGGAGPPPSECSTCVPPPRCTCVAAAGEWSMPVCWTSNDERLV